MRILWIAGLGAVLVTGGVSAQGMNAPQGGMAPMNQRALQAQPADEPDQIRRAQDPRLSQGRVQAQQDYGQRGPVAEGLRQSGNDRSPATIRGQQGAPQGQAGTPGHRDSRSPRTNTGTDRERGVSTMYRENAPRDAASRAYMGGGLILENGRPVPLPGDEPGAASDFRADNVEQSTARAPRPSGGTVYMAPAQRGVDPSDLVEPARPYNPQTNVGQTGVRDQGMTGSSQGAFPANPPTPGGRVPTGN